MREAAAKQKAELAVICTATKELKCAPLPSTVFWNGHGGKCFEDFIDEVTGHVSQQMCMSHLLLDSIIFL